MLISFLLLILTAMVSLIVVIGLALGAGWLLTLVLPFTLFEGSLLAIIAIAIVANYWYQFLRSVAVPESDEYDDFEVDDMAIPATRFYKSEVDKTWQAWVRFQISNNIYAELQESPRPVARMDQKQLQELAIRLADVTISWLKTKSPNVKQLRVTMANLKREMSKSGQQPYDDDILGLAIMAINEELTYHYEDIVAIIQARLWDKPCDLFDLS